MTKLAIKNENITSYGGIYYIMDVFSKLGFEKLTESVLGKRGSSYHTSPLVWVGILCLEKTQETPKHLISTYRAQKDISTYKIFSQEKYCGIKVRY